MVKAKLKMYVKPKHALFYITTCGLLALSLGGNIRGGAEASPLQTAADADAKTETAVPFLDAMELERREQSIASSLREDSLHRSLATGTCMADLYTGGGTLDNGCTANDFAFQKVTGVVVNDPGAYVNASNIWEGGCRGIDDYVNVSFTANFAVSNNRYDIGMYINTEGGSALYGTCIISLLVPGTYGTITVLKSDADDCPDFANSGTIVNYAFKPIMLKCVDTDKNGLLDFDIAVSWDHQASAAICNDLSSTYWPKPGTNSKCWHGSNEYPSRINLPVVVPKYNSPSAAPSTSPSEWPSSLPSASPSVSPSLRPSSHPSLSPSVSFAPSDLPSSRPSSLPSVRPSDLPSSRPSDSPSVSAQPSFVPSTIPSVSPSVSPSLRPSSQPSLSPSVSFAPSDQPSSRPSSSPSDRPSNRPSSRPSDSPSISAQPSFSPSNSPSVSNQPSVSLHPTTSTEFPSYSPSVSTMPSSVPSGIPSRSPSESPTSEPSQSPSDKPSSKPSASPTDVPSRIPSESPSVSIQPTFNTPAPSVSPSTSQVPSTAPSSSPTISFMPSSAPSVAPSATPSASPTGSKYYPDWINDSQVCKNDGLDPEYMMQVQKENYLYDSKEDCCRNHFWWRIQQCMGNEKPMYYSNGSFCDQKVFFEDWESKFTPGTWSASDQFDTLQECCSAKFYWDIEGCVAASPKELTFTFSFTAENLIKPLNCQDADTMGNALEVAINIGLGSSSISQVTNIGCASLSRNPDTDNTVCGGCLEGAFIGDYDGTRPAGYYTQSDSAKITVDVTTKSADCGDSACFQSLYNSIVADFTAFVESGDLTKEIQTWAANRLPPVPELWNSRVVQGTFEPSGSFTDPFNDPNGPISAISVTTTGVLSVSNLPTSLTGTEQQDLMAYFESSITDALEANLSLPDGAFVTITSISNGKIEYEITMNVATSTDANQAIAKINSFLDQGPNLASITADVQNDSSLTGLSITSNTPGSSTEATVSKSTSTGQLTTTINSNSIADMDAVEKFFEDSITKELENQGVLPEGSFVKVSIANGVVNYEITMFNDPSADAGSIVSSIDAALSESSTLDAIADLVKTESAESVYESLLSSLDVTGFVAGATTGVPQNPWYPNFLQGKSSCSNDGYTPSFMNDSPNNYLFTTKKECCDQWFSYDPFCATAASTKKKFYPDLSTGLCGKKAEKEFESFERDRYDTLEECCSAKFSSYNYDACCSAPGLGGCQATGVVVYLPQWSTSSCFAKSESALQEHEKDDAFDSASACCSTRFEWRQAACCKDAGGC